MKKYFNHQIERAIVVQKLTTIESLDVGEGFIAPEETHDFHEFAYIESGALRCCLEGAEIQLTQGDFLLIPPHKHHSYACKKGDSAVLFIVCFRCNSDILSILDKKISLPKELKLLIADILQESKNAFSFPFNRKLKLLQAPLYGSQQLVENNIEKLLIYLVRNETERNERIKLVRNSVEKERNLIEDVIALLGENLYSRLSLEEISRQTYYSKAFLNRIFNKYVGTSIIQYYVRLKIREAKKLLRENHAPSSVAVQLQFDSATYFTKVFKKHTGMTPSAYKKSVL